ncbi:PIH1 domain-containing protein 1 [Onthophagus taurus]|uniref:PIH1 domain-containing protein 1 n=1 Tax=Onthophagus taurus TaxID=166361 RepID=UPI000C207A00|nr:PIH1 domain-containing protein 1 [Onthophagus taurus]
MPKRSFLEVDDTLIGRNLKFTEPELNEFNEPFRVPGEQYPSKIIQPTPGFCCKSKEIGSDTKIFINVCKTDSIPPPKDITESELVEILNTEVDESVEFRVPMSIAEIRTDVDKKGENVKVIDVAINKDFFVKMEKSQLFTNFVVAVIFEAIANKNGVYATDERLILKNKKCFGNLQAHRVQQREIDEKMGIKKLDGANQNKVGIQVLEGDDVYATPEYRLYQRFDDDKNLFAEVKLPKITSSKELTLDMNDDRFILEAKYKKYLLDVFIPVFIQEDEVVCVFNTDTKILTIKMPIIQKT